VSEGVGVIEDAEIEGETAFHHAIGEVGASEGIDADGGDEGEGGDGADEESPPTGEFIEARDSVEGLGDDEVEDVEVGGIFEGVVGGGGSADDPEPESEYGPVVWGGEEVAWAESLGSKEEGEETKEHGDPDEVEGTESGSPLLRAEVIEDEEENDADEIH